MSAAIYIATYSVLDIGLRSLWSLCSGYLNYGFDGARTTLYTMREAHVIHSVAWRISCRCFGLCMRVGEYRYVLGTIDAVFNLFTCSSCGSRILYNLKCNYITHSISDYIQKFNKNMNLIEYDSYEIITQSNAK